MNNSRLKKVIEVSEILHRVLFKNLWASFSHCILHIYYEPPNGANVPFFKLKLCFWNP